MRIFFDFEFIEGGSAFVMEPVSIGMIRDDGAKYYAEFNDVDWSKANEFVLDNVKPHLRGGLTLKNKETIADEIKNFVGERPEFWAYFADYDWVLLCQLYGEMSCLPQTWPYVCLDIKQYMYHLNIRIEEIPSNIINVMEHHALADAEWNRKVFYHLRDKAFNGLLRVQRP